MSNYSVYMIVSPEGKRYIGMTMQKAEYRWKKGKGYITNIPFYTDIQKFGWERFEKMIIRDGLTKEDAEKLEQYYIKVYNTQNPEFGYNVEMGGVPECLAESTKKKISKSHKGLYRDETYRRHISEAKIGEKNGMYGKHGAEHPTSRAVIGISESEILSFESISDASRSLNLSKNAFKNISACCMGKRRTAYGYKWGYADDN